jgi:hypothetical protein
LIFGHAEVEVAFCGRKLSSAKGDTRGPEREGSA